MAIKPLAADEFYEALWDEEALASLSVHLAAAYGARSTLIQWHHQDGSADILSHSGYFTHEQLSTYTREFAHLDPWALAAARQGRNNTALDLEELVPVPEFVRSQFYNDYVRGMGDDTCRCIGVRMANSWGCGIIALQQGGAAQFIPEALHGLTQDAVHLRRVLSVRGKLAGLEHSNATFACLMDHMTQAVLLVRADGSLLYANAGGERFLSHSSAISVHSGRLEFRGAQSTQIRDAITLAADRSTPRMSSLLYELLDGSPLVITVLPIMVAGHARSVLLLVQELMPSAPAGEERLRALFGLTSAEAAVASLISDGLTIGEIAQRRRVSLETVRVQLRSITAKLRCKRQTEVAAIIRSIMPLPSMCPLSNKDQPYCKRVMRQPAQGA